MKEIFSHHPKVLVRVSRSFTAATPDSARIYNKQKIQESRKKNNANGKTSCACFIVILAL